MMTQLVPLEIDEVEEEKNSLDIFARTLYGEARGEGPRGIEAVAAVIMNRLARSKARGHMWWGDNIPEICLMPWQFSCWNDQDPNLALIRAVAVDEPAFQLCQRVARRAMRHSLQDPVAGATHYHHHRFTPHWAKSGKPVAHVGAHLFYVLPA